MSKQDMLKRAYADAGRGFMAYRLEKCFRLIKTQEDIAIHNDVMEEIFEMLGENKWPELINKMAELMYDPPKKKLMTKFSEWILILARKGK
jgi:hypothetical protein